MHLLGSRICAQTRSLATLSTMFWASSDVESPEPDEGADYLDAHLHGLGRVQHGSGHDGAVLGRKAVGRYFRCSPRPGFKVANCDLREAPSSLVKTKAKSGGNRSAFRFTCSFNRLTGTPYKAARSGIEDHPVSAQDEDRPLHPFQRDEAGRAHFSVAFLAS